jgi:hypothetical protein
MRTSSPHRATSHSNVVVAHDPDIRASSIILPPRRVRKVAPHVGSSKNRGAGGALVPSGVDGADAEGDEGVGVGAAPAHALALEAAVDDEGDLPFDEATPARFARGLPGAIVADPVALGPQRGEGVIERRDGRGIGRA